MMPCIKRSSVIEKNSQAYSPWLDLGVSMKLTQLLGKNDALYLTEFSN